MATVLILNAHQPYPFAKGRLNGTLVDLATELLTDAGHRVLHTATAGAWDIDEELAKHAEADVVLLQTPVNWMGVPWSFKRYMDEVYTAGMDGRVCKGDGRTRETPEAAHYGAGGSLGATKYAMSLTFNAPADAFGDPDGFFEGGDIDRLFWPMHLNFKFFGMTALPSFACFDVMKNPDIDGDLVRFRQYITETFLS
jgi:modulator of drug activity B